MFALFCAACIFPVAFATICAAFASYRGNYDSLRTRASVSRTSFEFAVLCPLAYRLEGLRCATAKVLDTVLGYWGEIGVLVLGAAFIGVPSALGGVWALIIVLPLALPLTLLALDVLLSKRAEATFVRSL